jgi:hypothetical protein
MKMEAIFSSVTPGFLYTVRLYNPEDKLFIVTAVGTSKPSE